FQPHGSFRPDKTSGQDLYDSILIQEIFHLRFLENQFPESWILAIGRWGAHTACQQDTDEQSDSDKAIFHLSTGMLGYPLYFLYQNGYQKKPELCYFYSFMDYLNNPSLKKITHPIYAAADRPY